MKKKLTLLLIFLYQIGFAQIDYKLPDSLVKKEIRIERFYHLGKSDVLRIYQTETANWKYEYYNSYNDKKENDFKEIIKPTSTDSSDIKLWLKILITGIDHIADQREIDYKFERYKKLMYFVDTWTIHYDRVNLLDGESFKISIRNGDNINNVLYSNPDGYLKEYPKIDELKNVVDLLNLIRKEFKMWEP